MDLRGERIFFTTGEQEDAQLPESLGRGELADAIVRVRGLADSQFDEALRLQFTQEATIGEIMAHTLGAQRKYRIAEELGRLIPEYAIADEASKFLDDLND